MDEKLIVIMYDIITLIGLLIFVLVVLTDKQQFVSSYELDEVKSLPGWSPRKLHSRHFSGFLDGDDVNNMKLHYWLVECETNPVEAPLIFWFNGGPGASSLYGLLIELGPYLLSDISLSGPEYEATKIPQLFYNPYGWQRVANIIAISMPPPIGFSYCNGNVAATGNDCTPQEGHWNDTTTAAVTYNAMLSFFYKFPNFRKNEVFIAGESYAGVYVPRIVQNILANADSNLINLKGFAVGDACTPPNICGSTNSGPFYSIEFLYGKGAFSNSLYDKIKSTCTTSELKDGNLTNECSTEVSKINNEVGSYWLYGYYDDCWYENDIRRRLSLINTSPNKDFTYYGPPIRALSSSLPSIDRVIDVPNGYYCGGPTAQSLYLANPEVKKALNVPVDALFFQCDNGDGFSYWGDQQDLVSWYKEIVSANKLRILVYNGDTDPCINSYESQKWTQELGFQATQKWRPWTVDGCQRIGGYTIRYENSFDFLTIKGSGHMVPQFKPAQALEFITRFIKNEDYQNYDASCTSPPVTLDTDESDIIYLLEKGKLEWANKEKYLLEKLHKRAKQ